MYVVHLKLGTGNEGLGLIESNWIIPSVIVNVSVTLNVTTNSTLSTNMFYRVTLFTAMDMMEAGSIQFCKCRHSHVCHMSCWLSVSHVVDLVTKCVKCLKAPHWHAKILILPCMTEHLHKVQEKLGLILGDCCFSLSSPSPQNKQLGFIFQPRQDVQEHRVV